MSIVRHWFFASGVIFWVFWLLGSLNIGHTHFYYGAEPIACVKGKQS